MNDNDDDLVQFNSIQLLNFVYFSFSRAFRTLASHCVPSGWKSSSHYNEELFLEYFYHQC